MAVSIDIGEGYINVIVGNGNGEKFSIKKGIYREFNKDIIKNGYIIKKDEFSLILIKLLEEIPFKKDEYFLNISYFDILRKEFNMPKVKTNKLEKLIENKINEIYENYSKYTFDYSIAGETTEDGNKFYKILTYAIPTKMLEDYIDVFMNAGIKLKCLDITMNTISNIAHKKINNKSSKGEILLFLDVTLESLNISLVSDENAVYRNTIDISDEIRREKIFLENKQGEYIEDKVKNKKDEEERISFLESILDTEESTFISPILVRIDEEINKMMQFVISRDNTKNLDKLYLYGNSPKLDEILKYILQNIMPEAEKIEKIEGVQPSKDMDISEFFVAIANALRK